MKSIKEFDWVSLENELSTQGAAVLEQVLSDQEVDALRSSAEAGVRSATWRHLDLAQQGAGRIGQLPRPLAPQLASLSDELVLQLQPIARRWREIVRKIDEERAEGTDRVLIERRPIVDLEPNAEYSILSAGDHILLRQGTEATGGFEFEATILLSQSGIDFRGGELAMAEQRPRMQSRPMVVRLKKGDVAVFSSGARPFNGAGGVYRVILKNAVSRVREGERAAINLTFGTTA
jgi:uncharacterized protein